MAAGAEQGADGADCSRGRGVDSLGDEGVLELDGGGGHTHSEWTQCIGITHFKTVEMIHLVLPVFSTIRKTYTRRRM